MASDRHMEAALQALGFEKYPTIPFWRCNVRRVAEALAQAERDGMRRAAEIARAYADEQDKTVRANAVVRAILSQAGEDA